MHLTHAFELPAPVDRVFGVFGQLDLLAPCFPGASVWGQDDDVYHGAVKIKFGPFPLVFEGTARVVRTDATDRRMVVKANARDRRGAAAGAAAVTATFSSVDSETTSVAVLTELDLTGRPAQLGSGAISSVSDRLADEFVTCLSARLEAGLTAAELTDGDLDAEDRASRPSSGRAAMGSGSGSGSGSTQVGRPSYGYRPPQSDSDLPHLQVLPAVLRTWLPVAIGAVVGAVALVVVVRRLRRR